jgi:hypothetical protein
MRTDLPGWLAPVSGGRVAVGGGPLRHWGLCETWRIRWADGSTTVVKRSSGEEARALDVYEHLLIPYRIAAPRLLAAHGSRAGRCSRRTCAGWPQPSRRPSSTATSRPRTSC